MKPQTPEEKFNESVSNAIATYHSDVMSMRMKKVRAAKKPNETSLKPKTEQPKRLKILLTF